MVLGISAKQCLAMQRNVCHVRHVYHVFKDLKMHIWHFLFICNDFNRWGVPCEHMFIRAYVHVYAYKYQHVYV